MIEITHCTNYTVCHNIYNILCYIILYYIVLYCIILYRLSVSLCFIVKKFSHRKLILRRQIHAHPASECALEIQNVHFNEVATSRCSSQNASELPEYNRTKSSRRAADSTPVSPVARDKVPYLQGFADRPHRAARGLGAKCR